MGFPTFQQVNPFLSKTAFLAILKQLVLRSGDKREDARIELE